MRVLFFLETPHRLAGSQRSLLAALTRIREHGVEPLVVFPAAGPVEDAYRAAGVPTRVVAAPPSLLLFNKQLLALGPLDRAAVLVREHIPYARTLTALIRDGGFDAVHFNTPRGIVIGGVAARLAGRPAVLHLRGVPEGFSRTFWTAGQLLATRIVLVARALEAYVAPAFRSRCTVVYNGVVEQPARDRVAARRALADRVADPSLADSDEVVFVSLSSLTPYKGLHHLIDAAAIARDRGVRARYVLAGGGGEVRYEQFLQARIAARGLERIVDVLGFVSDPLALLAAADAAVLPSVHREQLVINCERIDVHGTEGLPRSILESLSMGVPVVATRVQGVVEQVDDGVNGIVVAPSDPVALAGALERVAADQRWRERAAEAARRTARERFTVDAAAAGLAAVLLGARRRP